MKNKHHFIVPAMSCVAVFMPLQAQTITNVVAEQSGQTVLIYYDMSENSDVTAYVSINYGEFMKLQHVKGDVGANIPHGHRKIIWSVLEQFESFKYDYVRFKIEAVTDTEKDLEKLAQKKQHAIEQKWRREYKERECVPMTGFDGHGGGVGIGLSAYWGYVYNIPCRWGSYASYTFGLLDYTRANVASFHNIFLGVTCTLNRYCALFFAPGLNISETDTGKTKTRYIGSIPISDKVYENRLGVAAEVGVGVRCASAFLMSFRVSYPLYVGVGIGMDLGWY